MDNYKYGDWYCKSNNIKEIQEIGQRARASGAQDSSYSPIGDSYYGVKNGKIHNFLSRDLSGTEYTFAEVQKNFALPNDVVPATYENPYTAGTVCKFVKIDEAGAELDGLECVVISSGISLNGVFVVTAKFENHGYQAFSAKCFIPLYNKREKWLKEASDICGNLLAPNSTALVALYNALKSGSLEVPT